MGDLILMTLSAFGLALVAQAMGHLFLIVKIAGALYLLYLGYKYWTAPVAEPTRSCRQVAGRGFLAYLGLTLGNPKAIAFFVALLPVAINPRMLNADRLSAALRRHLVLIPAITLSLCGAGRRGFPRFVASRQARRRINKGAGAVMAGAGVA